MFFNVLEAAPENERDGPGQQAQLNVGGQVSDVTSRHRETLMPISRVVTRVFLMTAHTAKWDYDLYYDNLVIRIEPTLCVVLGWSGHISMGPPRPAPFFGFASPQGTT